jgi:hypothetical protein
VFGLAVESLTSMEVEPRPDAMKPDGFDFQ